jgi:hypothetical protein
MQRVARKDSVENEGEPSRSEATVNDPEAFV